MKPKKPLASLSLDLDNRWSYMKTHGDAGWETFPSYLPSFIPYALEVLAELDLKITFFVVGQDAALKCNQTALGLLATAGHEVGNHSFHHEPWFHRSGNKAIEKEIIEAEEQIRLATGQKPVGFRGPGFAWSPGLLEILSERGYLFDASSLATFLGPLARAYYFKTARLSQSERKQRRGLFGDFKDGFRPVKPYTWKLNSGETLLEIPVSTIPILKLPFHLSYLLYLSRYSDKLMMAYLNLAIRMCRLTKTEPSFLLHPLDLIGPDRFPELAFFPGMDVSGAKKIEVFRKVIRSLSTTFQVVKMGAHAEALLSRGGLKEFRPRAVTRN